jgi:hypothetical protein
MTSLPSRLTQAWSGFVYVAFATIISDLPVAPQSPVTFDALNR